MPHLPTSSESDVGEGISHPMWSSKPQDGYEAGGGVMRLITSHNQLPYRNPLSTLTRVIARGQAIPHEVTNKSKIQESLYVILKGLYFCRNS